MNKQKKILFLSPYPHDIGPSQRFRFEQYLDVISIQYKYEQITFWDNHAWNLLYSDKNEVSKLAILIKSLVVRWLILFKVAKSDLIFIHREVAPVGPPIFEWLIKFIFRKPIIYDFDDAIWFRNYSEKNKIARYFKAPWKVKYICRWSDVVIVGNRYLGEYALKYNSNIQIIPTTINTKYHQPQKEDNHLNVVIGWTGTLTTLRQLDPIITVIKHLHEKYKIKFLIISNSFPHFELSSLEYIKWRKSTEISDLQKIDIGIMPLYDDEWEKGKCGFKGLQYMSLEIPAVMSPVGVNTEIIEDGVNGFLASTEQEWFDKLSLLIEDAELRKRLGRAGRQTVVERYSIQANAPKYLEVLTRVLANNKIRQI